MRIVALLVAFLIALFAAPSPVNSQNSSMMVQEAIELIEKDDFKIAEGLMRKLLEREPDNALGHFYLAEAIMKQKKENDSDKTNLTRIVNAHRHYSKAAELDSQSKKGVEALAHTLRLEPEIARLKREIAKWEKREANRVGYTEVTICNNTQHNADIVIGAYKDDYQDTSDKYIQGWYKLASKSCKVFGKYVQSDFYYYAEQIGPGTGKWSGSNAKWCVPKTTFKRIIQSGYACGSDEKLVGFRSKELSGEKSTINLDN